MVTMDKYFFTGFVIGYIVGLLILMAIKTAGG